MTATATLTNFLLARIAEDEAVARALDWLPPLVTDGSLPSVAPALTAHIARHDPARVLAECEAKRRIVGLQPASVQACSAYHPGQDAYHPEGHLNEVLVALASVYAAHPDYREEWR